MGQKADQHRPHPEVQVAGFRHAPHASIHQWKPRSALLPSRHPFRNHWFFQQIMATVDVVKLHPIFHLKLSG